MKKNMVRVKCSPNKPPADGAVVGNDKAKPCDGAADDAGVGTAPAIDVVAAAGRPKLRPVDAAGVVVPEKLKLTGGAAFVVVVAVVAAKPVMPSVD